MERLRNIRILTSITFTVWDEYYNTVNCVIHRDSYGRLFLSSPYCVRCTIPGSMSDTELNAKSIYKYTNDKRLSYTLSKAISSVYNEKRDILTLYGIE